MEADLCLFFSMEPRRTTQLDLQRLADMNLETSDRVWLARKFESISQRSENSPTQGWKMAKKKNSRAKWYDD